jgi:type IV secretory pathway ATPase VirB11/archaellum biosynthesis ATPase/intein/homing endonuclease
MAEPRAASVSALRVLKRIREGYLELFRRKHEAYRSSIEATQPPHPHPPYVSPAQPAREEPSRGIEISGEGKLLAAVPPITRPDKSLLKTLNIVYPLIPRDPSRGQKVYAYADIRWSRRQGELIYYVVEPQISRYDFDIMMSAMRVLEERLDIDFFKLGEIKAKSLLDEETTRILSRDYSIPPQKMDILRYYLQRDIVGMGRLEPLMNDPNIEDISCDGVNIPIYVYHRDPKLGSLKTNIVFRDSDELNNFVIKMAQRCRKGISIAEPLLDASLPDGSRIQATLGTDIARKGSNFTIRRFSEQPLTPTHMLRYGTLNSTQLAYLWLAVENGQSILISGGTATGKTSMLNALSLFIRPNLKIVSIEDTPELRLPHPHWIPEVARSPLSIEGTTGEVSLFDLLKSSLRQRPDYIVMGEVRGKEAFVLFQQMASIPGDETVFVLNSGSLKGIPISEMDSSKTTGVPTFNPETGGIEIRGLRERVLHPPARELYRITTRTGREVTVTGNHSVFSGEGEAEVVSELREGDAILIPSAIPFGYNDIGYLNLLELEGIRVCCPELIKRASRLLGFERASEIAGFTTISNYYGVNKCALPAGSFLRLMREADIEYSLDDVKVRFERRSTAMPARLDMSPELLRLMGYHISEGSLNKARKNNKISLYNKNSEILGDMRKCIASVSGKIPGERKTRGFGESTELSYSNKVIFELLKQHTGEKGENKRIPDFIFGLSREKIGHFLSGLYSGDSCMCNDYFGYYTVSRQLANDLSLLLLSLGIVSTIRKRKRMGRKTTDYEILFYKRRDMDKFLRYVKPLGKKIRITKEARREPPGPGTYLDKIKRIERLILKKPVPVYDLSVPGTQNFIGGFGGILLHNTGHPSLATIHAASINQLVDRLTTPPISLPSSLIENVNIIVFLALSRLGDRYVRRASDILEVTGVKEDRPLTNRVFVWHPGEDKFKTDERSVVLREISRRLGLDEGELSDELARRKRILEWMFEQQIFDYREVTRIISTYYTNPKRVIDIISEKS